MKPGKPPHGSQGVAVVGGGLVGSLLAVFLARRGIPVVLYERDRDLRSSAADGGRSINLVLTARGARALERVGLDQGALGLTVRVTGRMIHALDGTLSYQPYGKDDSEVNYSISRSGLNRFLLSAAEGAGVRIRFRHRLIDVDLDAGRWNFEDGASSRRQIVESPLVFGADGAGSAVRRKLMAHPGFTEDVQMLGHAYKELMIPFEQGQRIEPNALHIWPRGDRMLMALPNLDGSFTVTLYLPDQGPHGFEALDTPERVSALFEEQFPDAVALIPDLTRDFFDNPTGSLGTVRCDPWHLGGRVALIGDAAHAIVPFFGQGMNCGFEDCLVLDQQIEQRHAAGWEAILDAFERERKPNADAIADMALENFVEMSDRVGDDAFLLRKRVEHLLSQRMPTEYRSRYSMVMYSSIPYRTAFEAGQIQKAILDELCDGLARADDYDPDLARRLIHERLTPFLRSRSVVLDY